MQLESVDIVLEEYEPVTRDPAWSEDNSGLWSHLRQLIVRGTAEDVTGFVEHVGSALVNLSVDFTDMNRVSPQMVHQSLDRILFCVPATLSRFCVRLEGPSGLGYGTLHFRPRHHHALLQKTHLTGIAIQSDNMSSIWDHEDFPSMRTAWPGLTHFSVQHRGTAVVPLDLPLLDVMRFVEHHLALRRLELPRIELNQLPEAHEVARLAHRLEVLRISDLRPSESPRSWFRTALKLALLIDRAFAKLDVSAGLCADARDGTRSPWGHVVRTIAALRLGRAQPLGL
ncbi:hypothetical protein BN946_scf184985.g22 [Trametes cinnabarina]|uniref:Uncharacterized protein n=1 Tax=Pycnoporus cinnabarinus TaxID=5643 RepID=A0A060SJH4_PYCCI|nr:hypothetical protein BN946_scf184985.g22 [Trametes cinnabarina]